MGKNIYATLKNTVTNLQKRELLEHVCYFLSISSLIEEVQL